MPRTLEITVKVQAIDVGCSSCTATLREVPIGIDAVWVEGHRRPVLLAVHLLVNGQPSCWVRRTTHG